MRLKKSMTTDLEGSFKNRQEQEEKNEFKVSFWSEYYEAVNRVKAKLLENVQLERSDSKDDVRPDIPMSFQPEPRFVS